MKLPADKVAKLRAFYEGRTVCVTGGAGFIGGHIVDTLVALGATISVIDDLSNSNLEHLSTLIDMEPDRVRFFQGSILDDDAMAAATEGCSVILHLAAMGSVPASVENPQRYWSVNATGTVRVLEAARAAGAQRVVLASSSSVYGDQPELPKRESHRTDPLSPYAVSKLAGEHLLATWARCYGLSTVSLRYFNIFGPRQAADSAYAAVVAAFAKRLLNGERPRINGTGEFTRDFTFVSNAVLATLLGGSAPGNLAGPVMNVGTGKSVSINQLAKAMAVAAGHPDFEPTYGPERAGDVPHSLADISEARRIIGYEPVATLEEGLEETMEWYRRTLAGA